MSRIVPLKRPVSFLLRVMKRPALHQGRHSSWVSYWEVSSQPLVRSTWSEQHILKSTVRLARLLTSSPDSTMVTTINTTLMTNFQNASLLSWLGASYFAANAWSQPLCGQLTDKYSRRLGLIVSIGIFIAGNMICAFSVNAFLMISGRFTAGVGGGAFIVITTFVANDAVPKRHRGLLQGINNIIFGLGHSLGGLIAAEFAELSSWRYAFIFLVVLSVPSGMITWYTMPRRNQMYSDDEEHGCGVDYQGGFLLSMVTGLILWSLNDAGFSSSPNIWKDSGILLAGCLVAVGFGYHSLYRTSSPILPLRWLRRKKILGCCLVNFCGCFSFTIVEFFLPIMFQLHSSNLINSANALYPLSAGAAAGSVFTGIVLWYGSYSCYLISAGFIFEVLGAALQASQTKSFHQPLIYSAIFSTGFGFGLLITSSLVHILQSTNQSQSARLTSLIFIFRSFGCSFGLSIGSLFCQNFIKEDLRAKLGDTPEMRDLISNIIESPLKFIHTDHQLQSLVFTSYTASIKYVLWGSAAVAAIGLIITITCLRTEHPIDDLDAD